MNDRQLLRLLGEAMELLDRAHPALPSRLRDMTEAMNGHPQSGALDRVGGRGKTTFCEAHGKERCACGAGTPFENVSDPTGEAGIRPDKAAVERRRLEEAIASIGRLSEEVVRTLARWTPRPPTDRERSETLSALNERDVSCWSCARTKDSRGAARWEPARCAIDVDGTRRELCRWCQDWVRQTSRLPSLGELESHHLGKQVRRPA